MRVFLAGGSGVLGRRLVPRLVERGHQVTATTTGAARLGLLARLGAEGVVMDGLDAASVREAVAAARPNVIVHQMTAIGTAHAGKADMKHMDRWFAGTNRLRTEGTDHLLAAAEAAGVPHVVAQSYGAWNGIREGGWVKTEEDPLDPMTGTPAEPGMAAIRHVEDAVGRAGGAVLRYGWFYGPGAMDAIVEPVRKRQLPRHRRRRGALLVDPPGRRRVRDRAGGGVASPGRVQHRRRRPGSRPRVGAAPGRVRGSEAAAARPRVAGPPARRDGGGVGDDRGTRLLQRQGQAGARLGAEPPLLA
ncbi:hypothetical protein Acsp03_30620 [Actinomadura sp. NBRC 104412]|uniref:NAD-dependent epimerase/dehydratase family protein n=1 Tax=Actinomadura sp. NBRC 104412 TaxID=3032203 RepID=UPI0024A2CEE6|nr:NAD(P)-dependent oxidoreductase [Actinomadura sp. NBRC 104412]GLZ05596.1 hypothetical protein Acsp03_30620 [Actinomadura sp. NBRC 104412]